MKIIKAYRNDAGEWVLDVLGVPFGGPDDRDAYGEFFNKDTQFHEDKFALPPAVYYHGFEPNGDESESPEYVGEVIESTKKNDGIWYKVILDKASKFAKRIWEAAQEGTARASSGSVPHLIRIDEEIGHITEWPVLELSIFDTAPGRQPANKYAVALPAVRSVYKSAGITLHESLIESNNVDGDAPIEPTTVKEAPTENEKKVLTIKTKGIKMDIEQLVEEFVTKLLEAMGGNLDEGDEDIRADDEELMEEALEAGKAQALDIAKKAAEVQEVAGGDIAKAVKFALENDQAAILEGMAEKIYAKAATRNAAAAQALEDAKLQAQIDLPPESDLEGGGKAHKPDPTPGGHISVSESLKYAHHETRDLALAVKLKLAQYPEVMRKNLTMGDVLSEDLSRHVAHRIYSEIKAQQPTPHKMQRLDRMAVRAALPIRADELDATAITNQGLEWISIWYDTDLWERARNMTELFNLLSARGMRIKTIPPGAKSMNMKLNTGSPTVYTTPEGQDVDATNRPEVVVQITPFTTDEVQVNARKHALATATTDDLEEDSVIDTAAFINEDAVDTLAESLESVLINGDTTTAINDNINLNDGTPGTGISTPDYIAWDGIRHTFLIDNTGQGTDRAASSLAIEDYVDVIALYSNPIKSRSDKQLFVIDKSIEIATRKLSSLLTRDVAGEDATIFSGPLPPLFDVQVYASGFLGLTEGDGTISATPANNTQGQIINVYAPYWQYGRKRAVTIEIEREAQAQATVFVASIRHAFAARGADAAVAFFDITP